MAVNDISPGFVRLLYQTGVYQSVMTLPVKPSDPDPLIAGNYLETNIGTLVQLDTAVTAFVNLFKGLYNTSTDFTYAELWSKPTPESDPLFIEVVEVAQSGTSGTANVITSQLVLTHRTAAGGLHRLYLMNNTQAPNQRVTAPFSAGAIKNVSDYMKGSNGWIFGRDNSQLIAPIAYTTKLNDALRKRLLGL